MINKYVKQCPHCENEFVANHLNRKYCSEICKRAAFRDKKARIRTNMRTEDGIELKNDKILAGLDSEKIVLTNEILKNKGFNFNYYHKKLKFNDGMLYIFKYNFNMFINEENIKIIKNS